jgi:hypothetical protein
MAMVGIIIGAVIGGVIGMIVGGAKAGGGVWHDGKRIRIETGSAWIQIKWIIILALIGAFIGGVGSALVR